MKLFVLWSVLIVMVAGMSSCGMQGDLYLPEKNTEEPVESSTAE